MVCVSWFCVRVYSLNIFQHLKYLKGSWAVLFRSGHIGSSSRGEPLITYEICNIINMLFLKGELESLVFVLKCLLLTFYKVQNTIWLRKACVLDLFWISNIQIIWHPSSCLKCFYPSPSDLNFSSTAPPLPPKKKYICIFSNVCKEIWSLLQSYSKLFPSQVKWILKCFLVTFYTVWKVYCNCP